VLYPAVIVSLETGLRRGELFRLEWHSIDLDGKELRVEGATGSTFETRDALLNERVHQTLQVVAAERTIRIWLRVLDRRRPPARPQEVLLRSAVGRQDEARQPQGRAGKLAQPAALFGPPDYSE